MEGSPVARIACHLAARRTGRKRLVGARSAEECGTVVQGQASRQTQAAERASQAAASWLWEVW